MKEIAASQVAIQDGFWGSIVDTNAESAIFHQWAQLEKTGCIENFRLVAGGKEGIREGFFFADSDAYKWLEAAARAHAHRPSARLKALMDGFVDLIRRAQTEDGYIYTYNQLFFPGVRWRNLQIEHELYCQGHLIEAGVSHFEATGERSLLDVARKAADLLVRDGPRGTPGHEEIEIALIRLYRITGDEGYLDLAERFIEQRGRIKPFILQILREYVSFLRRGAYVERRRAEYISSHPEHAARFQLPDDNVYPKPRWGTLRWYYDVATGKYFQQHRPVRKQTVPEGHAVRFAYLELAVAMLYRARGDKNLLDTLERAWEHMVTKRMYVTGGIGSMPNTEGFGRDYELDPVYAYAETCAALGSIFWSWEMLLATGHAKYADLIAWQLYNAAAVGWGQDGVSYFYNNPLESRGGLTRQPWFRCACCPPNLARTWADLGKYIYSLDGDIWVHQYIANCTDVETASGKVGIRMDSALPWEGKVTLTLHTDSPAEFAVHLRIPGWCDEPHVRINGDPVKVEAQTEALPQQPTTAAGYDPRRSQYLPLKRTWTQGDVVEIEFGMDIRLRATHPRVKATRGKVAVTRGPLVYCLESVDNPNVDIFSACLDPSNLRPEFSELFGGVVLLHGRTTDGQPLTFIPYSLWGNRGESMMNVYVCKK